MSAPILPNEATTEFLTHEVLQEHAGVQAFLECLTAEEQRRFQEIAHHLLHVGFEAGMLRRSVEPTEEAMARALVRETMLFSAGVSALATERD